MPATESACASLTPYMTRTDAFCSDPSTINLADAHVTPLEVPKLSSSTQYFDALTGVGTRWASGNLIVGESHSTPATPILINRTTGKALDLTGRFKTAPHITSKSYLDLNAAHPIRNLCNPVRRSGALADIATVTSLGGWTLQLVDAHAVLQRCGSKTKTTLPANAALGRGYVASSSGHTVTLRNLKTGSRRTFTFTSTAPTRTVALAFSANRLVISVRQADVSHPDVASTQRWTVSTVPL